MAHQGAHYFIGGWHAPDVLRGVHKRGAVRAQVAAEVGLRYLLLARKDVFFTPIGQDLRLKPGEGASVGDLRRTSWVRSGGLRWVRSARAPRSETFGERVG
jgi:hypothetical protein